MRVVLTIGEQHKTEEYERVFVISDIHNDYINYSRMREILKWDKGDLVIVNGDAVDRGDESADPLSLLNEIRFRENRNYDVVMLKGNHEKWLGRVIRQYCFDSRYTYHYNSLDLLASKLQNAELLEYADWMERLPLWVEMKIDGYPGIFRIAHASTYDLDSEKECLMGMPDAASIRATGKDVVHIVGHTPTSRARYYFDETSEVNVKFNTDILRVLDDKLWFIDCGNGYRDDEDFPGELGCIELRGDGKIKEYYV